MSGSTSCARDRKYAVITGASRGLGQHLAYRFWEAGYSLGLISRSIQSMHETTSALISSKGGNCDLFACDLSHPGSVQELVAEISEKAAQINVLVNNAAIQGPRAAATERSGRLGANDPGQLAQPSCDLQRAASSDRERSGCIHPQSFGRRSDWSARQLYGLCQREGGARAV